MRKIFYVISLTSDEKICDFGTNAGLGNHREYRKSLKNMARMKRFDSNQIFDVFNNWESVLEETSPDLSHDNLTFDV